MIYDHTGRNGLCRPTTIAVLLLAVVLSPAARAVDLVALGALAKFEVLPAEIRLHSPRDSAKLLVSGATADGIAVDLTREAHIASSDPAVAEYRDGALWPVGNGQCELVVEVGEHRNSVPVHVDGFDKPAPVSFRTETVAILTRHGCNGGACHGSPSGKGGFQLSLQAYDHAMDEAALVRGDLGRRTNCIEPAKSLLLLKPTMAVHHRGGLQLMTTDYGYDLLRQWISEGCRVDQAEGRRCVRLELLPATGRVLKLPHGRQQIVARAHFDDGTIRDVTRLAKFSSSDDQVVEVTASGVLVGRRRGQAAVMARYLDQLVSFHVTIVEDAPDFHWPDPPAANYIDELVHQKLRLLQFEPSAVCTDNEFLRRVYLDLLGVLPSIDEQREFLADSEPQRRVRLIDRLLNRPEYARFWALKWADLLRLQKSEVAEAGVHKFYDWLVDQFDRNAPLDKFARQLLTAQGSTFDSPPANYYRAFDDAAQAAESTAQIFLGSRIQCAKCHNHPFENWTQDNFYGLTAFFNRVSRKPGLRAEEQVVFVARGGEVTQPRTGQTMQPWLPEAGVQDAASMGDRREAFARWLTAPGNPFFARVAVNRIWAEVMGRGIVEPVDDVRQSNPPAIPELLDRLAQDFVEHGFDQKQLLRTILSSRTYQLSSRPTPSNREDAKFFSHARVRLLTAEQLLDAVCEVTQLPEPFAGMPVGTRATGLPSPDFKHDFLDDFGRPARATACACERSRRSTLAQSLQMLNGAMVRQKIADKGNRFRRSLDEGCAPPDVVTTLYRAAVCREPSDEELNAAMEHIASQQNVAEGMADVCWALLNTDEFLTQH